MPSIETPFHDKVRWLAPVSVRARVYRNEKEDEVVKGDIEGVLKG